MNEFIGNGGESPKEILEILQSNADGTEPMQYVRYFSEDELAEKNEKFLSQSIEFEKLSDDLAVIKKQFKGKMDPLKAENRELLTMLKDKGESLKEDVYKFIDQEEKAVGYYSKEGKLIHSRPIRRDEITQGSLFKMPAREKEPTTIHPDKRIESQATGTEGNDFKFPTNTEDDDKPF